MIEKRFITLNLKDLNLLTSIVSRIGSDLISTKETLSLLKSKSESSGRVFAKLLTKF
jgi:hypothetical protein